MTICLAFICKNESHCVARMLESVKPYIDSYVAVDTGSTDRTVEIIQEVMKDVRGTVYCEEWKDFSTNRNSAISKAKGDYILMLDCDDWLQVDNANWAQDLTADVYDVEFHHANVRYHRPQLWKSSLGGQYVGVLHEYLSLPQVQSKKLQGAHIQFGASGSRSQNPNKYYQDCLTFEKAGHLSARDTFYYAQSLRDAGYHQQAMFQYLKRSQMNDWIEERYISLLEIGKMYHTQNPKEMDLIEEVLLSAYSLLPIRGEALYYLALYYRQLDDFKRGYAFAKLGMSLPLVDGLFVEADVYAYKLKDECAVDAYWLGLKTEGKKLNMELLAGHLPSHERPRIIRNLECCQ